MALVGMLLQQFRGIKMADIIPADFYALNGGNPVLTLTGGNGTFNTANMGTSECSNCQVYIEFYSDSAGTVPVTPTAGTVTVSASPLGNVFLAPGSGAVVQANTVNSTGVASYNPPAFQGRVAFGQVTFAGIAGAGYAKVSFWRY